MSQVPSQRATSEFDSDLTSPRIGWVIGSMCLTVGLIIAGVGGLTVTIPQIGTELGASQSELQWVLDAFALTLAALLLPMGAFGDLFGRRRLMLIGLAIFVAAGLWATWSGGVSDLIAARAVGGVGAAMVFPGTLATLTSAMPDSKRGLAVALWTASASLGGTIGSFVAGLLIESFWYGSVFLGTALLGVAIFFMIWWSVPETSDPEDAGLDPIGAILSIVGIGAFVFAVIEGPVKGWLDPLTVIGFVTAVVGLVGFVIWELRATRPLLDVRHFQNRGFATGAVSIFLQFVVVFGYFFVASQYLAFVVGYSPLTIAAALLPVGILLPFTSILASRLAVRFGRGPVGSAGLFLMGLSCVATSFIDTSWDYWVLGAIVAVFGAGMGLAAPPATEAIVEALPPSQQGVASATNDLARELGGAVGIAILGSALTTGYRSSIDRSVASISPDLFESVRDSAAAGLGIASTNGTQGESLALVVQDAVVDGFVVSMYLAAAVLLIGAMYVGLRGPRGPG